MFNFHPSSFYILSSTKYLAYCWIICLLFIVLPTQAQFVYDSQIGSDRLGLLQLGGPKRIAVDAKGNLYVADYANHRILIFDANLNLLRKIERFGFGDGQIFFPTAITVDLLGNIYVNTNSRIMILDNNGNFKKNIILRSSEAYPLVTDLAIDNNNNLYVVDNANNKIAIFKKDTLAKRFGSAGSGDGQFNRPTGITLDKNDNIYIVDQNNYRIQVFDKDGNFIRKFGSQGSNDGQFINPQNLSIDNLENIYVSDKNRSDIQIFNSDGIFQGKFGGYDPINKLRLLPEGIQLDANNNVYVTSDFFSIKKFDNKRVLIASIGTTTQDGQFLNPEDISFDKSGKIYVADISNARIQVFNSDGSFFHKFNSSGQEGISTFPNSISVDSLGFIYVTDGSTITIFDNKRTYIRRFGSTGSSNGQFSYISDIVLDKNRNLYVVDSGNDRIQIFNNNGDFIRSFGSSGKGIGQFDFASYSSITLDSLNNIYVTDSDNSRVQVFTNNGTFLKEIGTSGKWGLFATLLAPAGIALDKKGNIYVTEHLDLGMGVKIYDKEGNFLSRFGDFGTKISLFQLPTSLQFDKSGNLYVCDTRNNRIQIFKDTTEVITDTTITTGLTEEYFKNRNVRVFPNPSKDVISIKLEMNKPENINFQLFDLYGREVKSQLSIETKVGENLIQIPISNYPAQLYTLQLKIGNYTKNYKILKQ